MGQAVLFEVDGAIAKVRLNRPDRLNTIEDELGAVLLECVRRAASDPAVRVLLLSGAGRSFMAGADLAVFAQDMAAAPETACRLIDLLHASLRLIRDTPKPAVASVQGPVAGGGLGLAMACDFVIAADDAKFISAYTRIGTTPDAGTTWSLTRLLGRRRAFEVIALNDPVSAEQALAHGMVNAVVPVAELDAATLKLANRLAAAAPGALAGVKRLVNAAGETSFTDQLDLERAAFAERAATDEFREGVRSFLERREPRF